ncbi:hypothetical protein [Streptomyces sp. NPDC001480]
MRHADSSPTRTPHEDLAWRVKKSADYGPLQEATRRHIKDAQITAH